MSRPVATVRFVSVLMGVIIGSILAYAYQVNLPTLVFEVNLASIVVYASIPLFVGFLAGLLSPQTGVKDALLVGLLSGLVNSIIATLKLIFAPILAPNEAFAFALYAIMSVFIWMILAAAAAAVAAKTYE